MESSVARRLVFALTWIGYASYYLGRKQLAVTKARLQEQFQLSLGDLNAIDTGYLAAYAGGLFVSGLVCDAIGPRRLIGGGLLLAAGLTATFGLSSTPTAFALTFALGGLAQSTGWPANVKAMTPWFAPSERGRVMGVWSTCYQVGGIAATVIASWLFVHHGWRAAFVAPAFAMAAVAIAVWLLLPEPATAAGAPRSWRPSGAAVRALRSPQVWNLGATYFGLKLIRYSLLFWLPLYLNDELRYGQGDAGYLSVSFEVGGVVGAVTAGALSDRGRGRRGAVIALMCLGLAAALALYIKVAARGPVPNFAAMALVGFMLFGPDALVSSTAAQDLGGAAAAGTAAGVINGVGSAGAILQGTVTTLVKARWGWPAVFVAYTATALACALAMLPFIARERASGSADQRAAKS
jgi:OPA family sugar phosphate sensor protein UhpC-like MFS transporter